MNFNRFFFDGCIHFTAISGQVRFNNKRKLPPVISKKGVKLGSVGNGNGVRFKVGVNLRTVNYFSSVFNVLQRIRFLGILDSSEDRMPKLQQNILHL